MKKTTYASLMLGIFFGCICYVVCLFFLNAYFSALLGILSGTLYFFIFYILSKITEKKQAKILSEYGKDFLFNVMVNYYGDNELLNGLLVLTESTLSFIATEKKRIKIDYPIHQIAEIEYRKIIKYISGLSVLMQDGTSGRFALTQKEYELLEDKLNLVKYGSKLLSDIKKSTKWIIETLNSSGYKVDMSVESLREVDRFFNEQMDDISHTPKQDGLLSENMGQRLFSIASFVGEVLINEYGGKWITDDNDEQGEINVAVLLSNGSTILPVQRVMKRYGEGSENGIYDYVMLVGRK